MEPKLSVIVPIYNVEPYLRKSLDSIAGQTYRNLEIILVDDGSPDACPAICDEYAANDPRFKVIHQVNRGRASARNAGLDAVTGDWIGWVDPDDWVESDMFEYLLKGVLEYEADIAVCGNYRVDPKGTLISKTRVEQRLLNREEGVQAVLFNAKGCQRRCWDKLWRRRLWEGIRFSEDYTYYEDTAIIPIAFERAERTVCLPEPKYYYVYNEENGSATAVKSLKKHCDRFRAYKESNERFQSRWPQLNLEEIVYLCMEEARAIWASCLSYPRAERRAILPQLREISAFCRLHMETALRETKLGRAGQLQIRLTAYPTWWSFWLAQKIGRAYCWKYLREIKG